MGKKIFLFRIVLVTILLMCFVLLGPVKASTAHQDKAIERGVAYLRTMQNNDGGFTDRQGTASSSRLTHWAIMALSAAGEDVTSSKWRKNGNSPIDFLLRNAQLEETTEYARTLLALRAAGYRGTLNGINLEDKILSFQKANGQFSQYDKGEKELINAHVWSIFALAAGEREIPQKNKVKEWLLAQQNIDGGFGWAVGGNSDPDSTGVAITALVILGEDPNSSVINRAVRFLKTQQESNGGFKSDLHRANTASSAWAIQGLLAVGINPKEGQWNQGGNNPYSHLISLQKADGSFDWMESRQSSPVLMTSYAIMALAEKPFPVNMNFKKETKKIVLTIDNKEAWIGNKKANLDIAPTIIEGRTMVPLRFIAESLGADIKWHSHNQKIEIKLGEKELSLFIGQTSPGLDSPPIIVEGRTMVPIRYISENLGAKVTWFGAERKIEIVH